MKIVMLVLEKCIRLRLKRIDRFEYRPDKKVQVILGTNGSGKSSIMNELSPLPANSNDYEPGGKKLISIDHQGSLYELWSIFDEQRRGKFSFIKDGENLNPGFGIKGYSELVKEHFNYTEEIHLIMTGAIRFHDMPVNKRRAIFMALPRTDYSFAQRYYKQLVEETNELQVAIKIDQQRLAREQEREISPERDKELATLIANHTRFLNILLENKIILPQRTANSHLDNAAQMIKDQLVLISNTEDAIHRYLLEFGFTSEEDIREEELRIHGELRSLTDRYEFHIARVGEIQKKVAAAKQKQQNNKEEINKRIAGLEEEYNELLKMDHLGLWIENPESTLQCYQYEKTRVVSMLDSIMQSGLTYKTAKDPMELSSQLRGIQENTAALTSRLINFQKKVLELKTLKDQGTVECPKCSNVWIPNFSERNYINAQEEVLQCETKLEALKKEYETLSEAFTKANTFTSAIAGLDSFTRPNTQFSNGDIKPIALFLLREITNDNIEYAVRSIDFVERDLANAVKRKKIRDQIKELELLIANNSDEKEENVDHVQKSLEIEEAALLKAQVALQDIRAKSESFKNFIKIYSLLMKLCKEALYNIDQIEKEYEEAVSYKRKEILDDLIGAVKLELTTLENQRASAKTILEYNQRLRAQLEKNQIRHKLLKMSCQALSPKEGLIARGMTSFINHFTDLMNDFIAMFWSYPLSILPVEVSEEDELELSYRFRVSVNDDKVNQPPDVQKTSNAQKQIIDLAFMDTCRHFVGLDGFPLFLDEFGSGMDYAHRVAAFAAVDRLIENSNYGQIFLISHYEQCHGSLVDADFTVLCQDNIPLPPDSSFNNCVKIDSYRNYDGQSQDERSNTAENFQDY